MSKICFFHKWVFDERPSRNGDFISGYSPIFYYEKCSKCGKLRNNSSFSQILTDKIEKLNIMGEKLKRKRKYINE